jgi:hypothetical protein
MEGSIPAESYVHIYKYIQHWLQHEKTTHQSAQGLGCSAWAEGWEKETNVPMTMNTQFSASSWAIINSNRRRWTGKNYKPDEDNLHEWVIILEWIKWQWQGRTKDIILLLLRPDWLRKNQTIWQHVTPWSLKECCLLKGQPCRKQPEILHESDSRAKKHRTY